MQTEQAVTDYNSDEMTAKWIIQGSAAYVTPGGRAGRHLDVDITHKTSMYIHHRAHYSARHSGRVLDYREGCFAIASMFCLVLLGFGWRSSIKEMLYSAVNQGGVDGSVNGRR